MTYRGKRRRIASISSSSKEDGAYVYRCIFDCGHTGAVWVGRKRDANPSTGYCNHPECIWEVEAA